MRGRQARKILKQERAEGAVVVRGSTHRRALRFLLRGVLRGNFWPKRVRADWEARFPPEFMRESLLQDYVLDLGGAIRKARDPLGFAFWYGDLRNRRVAFDELHDGTEVSTVFLGIDHNFRRGCTFGDGGDAEPILFETAVRRPGQSFDVLARSSSRADALEGHALIIGALMSGKFEENDSGLHIDMDARAREGGRA